MEEFYRESEPFIGKVRDDSVNSDTSTFSCQKILTEDKTLSKLHTRRFFSVSAILITILTVSNCFFAIKWRLASLTSCIRPQLTFSPVTSITRYEKKTLWRDIDHNVFTGPPRPEFDEAWHELLSPMVIRISNDELKHIGKPSLAFRDGSGFIAETAAYHELHCVKRLRRHLYVDHYYPNMSKTEQDRENRHVEYLREAAMCHGDPTLVPFHWEEGKPFSSRESTHECIDWESYAVWAEERKVDASDYPKLTDDVVYPN